MTLLHVQASCAKNQCVFRAMLSPSRGKKITRGSLAPFTLSLTGAALLVQDSLGIGLRAYDEEALQYCTSITE